MKECTKCGEQKSVESFFRSNRSKDGCQSQCKACTKKRQQAPSIAESRRRSSWLACLKKFGITEDQYHEMFDRQFGLCAICHRPERDIKLAVDHCHETGKVRGLLCKRCNMGIGLLNDDRNIIASALLYITDKR